MKFAVASYGTRGDIEPCAAVGLELQRRGHEVRMAVPPNLIGFVEAAGLSAVAYGNRDSQQQLDEQFLHNAWKLQNPVKLLRDAMAPVTEGWAELSAMLTPVADGVDLLLSGQIYQEVVANVAEHHDIPLAALHFYPMRANGEIAFPARLPSPVVRSTITTLDWLYWRMTKGVEDAQRRELGLPKASSPAARRMAARGALEIQAYDELCFPGLAAEWAAECGSRRPFVGALTLELPTDSRRRGGVLDRLWYAPDLLRFRQHAGGISGRPGRHDRCRVRAAGRAGADLLRACRLQPAPAIRPCEGGPRGQPRGDLPHLPRGRPPRRCRYHRRRPEGRSPDPDPVGHVRSADLGGSDETAESRQGAALLGHDAGIAGCGPTSDSRAGLCCPGPRARLPDDQTRSQRRVHRRPAGRRRSPTRITARRDHDRRTLRLCPF